MAEFWLAFDVVPRVERCYTPQEEIDGIQAGAPRVKWRISGPRESTSPPILFPSCRAEPLETHVTQFAGASRVQGSTGKTPTTRSAEPT